METYELGVRLRNRRLAAGRTIASVATDAGLSVPYIANLENGRGNPTLSAVNSLARALGAQLTVDLIDDGQPTPEAPATMPDTLTQLARSARFTTETARLAAATRTSETLVRERVLHAFAAIAALAGRPMSDLDWHRLLDALVLISRD